MTSEKMLEIQTAAAAAAADVVKQQVAGGKPNKGMSKARHAAVVADTVAEILASYTPHGPNPDGTAADEEKHIREVLRATFSGDLLNASQFRQNLEKAGVLVKETALSNEYGV